MENADVNQQKLTKDEQHLICQEMKAIADKMDAAITANDNGTWQMLTIRLRELVRLAQRTVSA